jgi:Ca2+-binding EF-hand superfamily protein
MRASFALFALLAITALAVPAASQDRRRGGDPWERMKRYDKDGDGKVTRAEFGGPARAFERFDSDADGVITHAEVSARAGSGKGTGGQTSSTSGRSGSADIEWVTKRLDMNRDGIFDANDLVKITAAADKDGDGKVSRKELLDFLQHADRPIPRGEAPDEGAKAPGFEVRALKGTGSIKLEDLVAKGRPVVVAFGSLT